MKGIDKKYIDVLQQFGFHLYTTETGYKLCYNPIGGTFSANFNDENFVENLINFAETFDPSTYASVEIEGPCSINLFLFLLSNGWPCWYLDSSHEPLQKLIPYYKCAKRG